MNQAQGELLRCCPYDTAHKVKKSRFLIHLTKCRKSHPGTHFKQCPFSAEHVVPASKLMEHIYCCDLNHTSEVFLSRTDGTQG
ncbi:hypothetical protein MTO96_018625 [Rhipicephalus appendiculatus]